MYQNKLLIQAVGFFNNTCICNHLDKYKNSIRRFCLDICKKHHEQKRPGDLDDFLWIKVNIIIKISLAV